MNKKILFTILFLLCSFGLNGSGRFALPRDIQIGQDVVYNNELYSIAGFEKQATEDYKELTLQLEKPFLLMGIEFYRTYLTLTIKEGINPNDGSKTDTILANTCKRLALKTHILTSLVAYYLIQNCLLLLNHQEK